MRKAGRLSAIMVFVMIFCIFLTQPRVQACNYSSTFAGTTITPTATWQTAGSVQAGARYQFTASQYMVYVFSYCDGGGSNSGDTQIEIFSAAGVSMAENDDFCTLGSKLTWVAPASGTYYVVTFKYNCLADHTVMGTMAYKVMTQPNNQDCLGAIPLCFNTYSTTISYSGVGNYTGEIPTTGGCPGNCLLSGERNDVWYTFTVQSSGTVSFLIDPVDNDDDYDWAVYNLTNNECATIASNPSSVQVSCNYTATAGNTGPNGGSTNTCIGASGTPYNAALNVTAGQTYVVNVSNFSSTQNGYSITFGGSAQILDNSDPFLTGIVYAPVCGQNNITVQFSENVTCLSISPSDFFVTGPGGTYTISDVVSSICAANGSYDDTYTLMLSDPLSDGGTYTVGLTSTNGINDICYNQAVNNGNFTFSFTGLTASGSVTHNVTCYGGTDGAATVTSVSGGTPPYDYTWSNGATTQSVANLPGGVAYVTVSDFYDCQEVLTFNITQPSQIIVEAGTSQPVCPGNGITLGGSPTITNGVPPLTYGWSPTTGLNNPASLNPVATPSATTTYTITVQDNTGCTASDNVTITLYPAATVNLGPDVQVCSSALPYTIDAGAGYTNYDWSVNAYDGSQTMPVSASGNYSVTVTNSNGCTATDNINVTVVSNPVVNLGIDQTVCSEDLPFTLNAGPGFAVYDWNIDAYDGSQTMPVNTTGSYSVTVSDGSGCTGSDQISITVDPLMNITLVSVNPLCFGTATGSITANVTGGTPAYQYYWSNGQTTPSISGLSAGVTYAVTVTDNIGCSVTASAVLTSPPQLVATVTTQPTECGQAIGSATVSASGGAGGYTYLWNTSGNSDQIINLIPGTYSCTVTDANGCSVVDSEVVGIYGSGDVVITLLQPVLCNGFTTGVLQGEMTDGTAPFQYSWLGLPQHTAVVNNLPAGNYNITITDTYGCTGTASYTITEPPAIAATSEIVDVLCRGGNNGAITLTVTGGVSPYVFQWSGGQTSSHISGLTAASYSVVITDMNNCTYQGFYTIEQPEKEMDLTLLTQDVICYNQNTGAAIANGDGGTPPYVVIWFSGGVAVGNGSEINSLPAGTYEVLVRDANNCEARRFFTITEPAEISLEYSVTAATCMGNDDGQALISVIGGTQPYSFEWNTGDMLPLLEDATAGQYVVSVTDANECTKMLNIYIPESNDLCLRIPNAFTPNDDGINDTWVIDYIDKYPLAQVYVFNRWGQKMYDKGNNQGPWDGKLEGKKVPTGSYTYIVDLRNGMEPFTGVVVVVH